MYVNAFFAGVICNSILEPSLGLLVFAARETVFPARCVSPTTNPCSAGERKCAKMCDLCHAFFAGVICNSILEPSLGLLVFAARETVFPARCVSPTTNACSAGERKCAKMCDLCHAFFAGVICNSILEPSLGLLVFAARETVFPAHCVSPTTNPCSAGERKCAKMCDLCNAFFAGVICNSILEPSLGLLVFAARETVFPAHCVSPTTNPCSAGERKCAKMCDLCNAFFAGVICNSILEPSLGLLVFAARETVFPARCVSPTTNACSAGERKCAKMCDVCNAFSRVSSAIQFWSPLWVYWCLLQGKQCFRRIAFPPLPTHAVLGKGNVPRCVIYVMHFRGCHLQFNFGALFGSIGVCCKGNSVSSALCFPHYQRLQCWGKEMCQDV